MSAAFIRRLRTPGSSDRSSVGPALGEHDIILGVSNMGCTGRQTLNASFDGNRLCRNVLVSVKGRSFPQIFAVSAKAGG